MAKLLLLLLLLLGVRLSTAPALCSPLRLACQRRYPSSPPVHRQASRAAAGRVVLSSSTVEEDRGAAACSSAPPLPAGGAGELEGLAGGWGVGAASASASASWLPEGRGEVDREALAEAVGRAVE